MIAAAAFVIGFVAIALTVLFFAMGGGSGRGARENLHGQSRGSRRTALVLTGVAIAAFGVAIPLLAIDYNKDDGSKKAPGGVELTAFQQDGRKLFAKNCSTCHTLAAANGVGKVGPDLDVLRPNIALVINAIEAGRAQGRGQMPALLLDGDDAKAVASFIAATAGH